MSTIGVISDEFNLYVYTVTPFPKVAMIFMLLLWKQRYSLKAIMISLTSYQYLVRKLVNSYVDFLIAYFSMVYK